MIATLIIFYGSLALIALMVALKWLEQAGSVKIMTRFNAVAEPVVKKFAGDARDNLTVHLNIRRVGLLTISTLRIMEKFLLSAQIKIRRWSETLTRKVRYHNLNKPKGTVSFFLKDITDYKNHLPRKKNLDL
ncbi:MAG: hypothetical protein A3D52_03280 [Candidatus Taylorbacteria bacterium RIFCSPHIGHO2_02_FULL_44_36]|uniref:Uncharacterized protein n=1 Tax=Candidatus Taylorbacteria bacterium RIFCSPLOWO2_12_FULL_44_15c TaxID=1802333 RepID=A0A1G2P5Q6_9BACT|nr:MAG: hypothetical protein A3D52_03280 [Candidatus Taylorbacteria bacterium RIFCSPHIGHO2_02_FULL_44_36]OHA38419.1 MAG: hypothetical protein A3I97_01210 [Candidatus Taylorbacteria bacterium RIFCSPLOWO2_02_FULL_44_35]OHA43029.1 MAG: hypothetical protein A3G03_03105 [Candidatus Taylorbacteria bacterium RIFCSPLOWO2_12_FULL_44_15c]